MGEEMVIAVLGRFGGRRASGSRHLMRVDRDTLDAVMQRMAVDVAVPDGDATVTLRIDGMEAFHPDSVIMSVPGLTALLRGHDAAHTAAGDPTATSRPTGAPHPVPAGQGLLDAILGGGQETVEGVRGVRVLVSWL